MSRYRATVEYVGTRFSGFQRQQSGLLTVQGTIEEALFKLVQTPVKIVGAGRTDAGVHARGQVIAFDLPQWRHDTAALTRALNVTLARDVGVRDVEQVSADFHPRFDAKRRGYRYTIYNGAVRRPLYEATSWHVPWQLDLAAMAEATRSLVGKHDFATFGTPSQGNNTVRQMFSASWVSEPPFLYFEIEGTAFLKRMVRSLVGSLQLVGSGRWQVSDFVEALQRCDRQMAGPSAPPQGLVLEFVCYE